MDLTWIGVALDDVEGRDVTASLEVGGHHDVLRVEEAAHDVVDGCHLDVGAEAAVVEGEGSVAG